MSCTEEYRWKIIEKVIKVKLEVVRIETKCSLILFTWDLCEFIVAESLWSRSTAITNLSTSLQGLSFFYSLPATGVPHWVACCGSGIIGFSGVISQPRDITLDFYLPTMGLGPALSVSPPSISLDVVSVLYP